MSWKEEKGGCTCRQGWYVTWSSSIAHCDRKTETTYRRRRDPDVWTQGVHFGSGRACLHPCAFTHRFVLLLLPASSEVKHCVYHAKGREEGATAITCWSAFWTWSACLNCYCSHDWPAHGLEYWTRGTPDEESWNQWLQEADKPDKNCTKGCWIITYSIAFNERCRHATNTIAIDCGEYGQIKVDSTLVSWNVRSKRVSIRVRRNSFGAKVTHLF